MQYLVFILIVPCFLTCSYFIEKKVRIGRCQAGIYETWQVFLVNFIVIEIILNFWKLLCIFFHINTDDKKNLKYLSGKENIRVPMDFFLDLLEKTHDNCIIAPYCSNCFECK